MENKVNAEIQNISVLKFVAGSMVCIRMMLFSALQFAGLVKFNRTAPNLQSSTSAAWQQNPYGKTSSLNEQDFFIRAMYKHGY